MRGTREIWSIPVTDQGEVQREWIHKFTEARLEQPPDALCSVRRDR